MQHPSGFGNEPSAALPHLHKDSDRLPGLDALRGLAIVFVVAGHFLPGRVLVGEMADTIVRPFALGGVALFLLLSGFLIERNLGSRSALGDYALRRAFRILPAFWVTLGILLIVDRLFIAEPGFGSLRQLFANAFLVPDVLGVALMSGVFWTLLIESKFYIIAPFVTRAGRMTIIAAPFAVIALNTLVMARRGEASNLLTYLACCLAGMNFGLWHRGELPSWALAVLVAVLSASLGLFSPYFKFGLAIFGLANAAALAAALAATRAPTWLSWIGAVSYSWYLYHAGIGYPLMAWLDGPVVGLPVLMSTAIGIGVTLTIAWASYRYIEQPAIRFGHQLAKGLRSQRPTVSAGGES